MGHRSLIRAVSQGSMYRSVVASVVRIDRAVRGSTFACVETQLAENSIWSAPEATASRRTPRTRYSSSGVRNPAANIYRFPEYYVRMFQIRLTKNDGVINLGNLEPEEITVDFAMDCAPASRIVRVVGKLSPRLGEVSTRSCREGSTIVR